VAAASPLVVPAWVTLVPEVAVPIAEVESELPHSPPRALRETREEVPVGNLKLEPIADFDAHDVSLSDAVGVVREVMRSNPWIPHILVA